MTTKLTAKNLKNALWDTMQLLQSGCVKPQEADALARQAREILRITNSQLKIAQQSERQVPLDVINFSEE